MSRAAWTFLCLLVLVGPQVAYGQDRTVATAEGVALDTAGLVRPVPDRMYMPVYSSEAAESGLAGELDIAMVVDATGAVVSAKVAKSLDKAHGLDEQAMFAVGKWTFEPGALDGQPVAVALTCRFRFVRPGVVLLGSFEP